MKSWRIRLITLVLALFAAATLAGPVLAAGKVRHPHPPPHPHHKPHRVHRRHR